MIWASTQHYADFATQVEAVTGATLQDEAFFTNGRKRPADDYRRHPRALIGGRQRAALIALLALQQRGEERLALHGFIGHALVDQHRLHAAAFGAGRDKAQSASRRAIHACCAFFSNVCCLPTALQGLLPGLVQLFVGRLILRGRALIHFGLGVGVAALVRQRRAAGQQGHHGK
jgi:hypothetical protein